MARLSNHPDTAPQLSDGATPPLDARRSWAASVIEFWVGLADSLHRNILLSLLVLVLCGAVFQVPLYEIALIVLCGYLALMAIASISRRP